MKILHILFLLTACSAPIIKTQIQNATHYPTMAPSCICPHTCNNMWRGNNICDMECNIAECNWDDGDCPHHIEGVCRGNITLENIETDREMKGYCDNGANTQRICEHPDHLKLKLPWRVKKFSCTWIIIKIHKRELSSKNCHSMVKCTSDKWCQQDCPRRIKEYPEKCIWDWQDTKYPTKFPSPYPSKFPSPYPSKFPSPYPSKFPSPYPTISPSNYPSKFPTTYPTSSPTNYPTTSPSRAPTAYPSRTPSSYPSRTPTEYPSRTPTQYPSDAPIIKHRDPPDHHDDHHHHDTKNDSTNKYDMAIAGIIIAAIVIVIGIIMYYRKQIHKAHIRQATERREHRRRQHALPPIAIHQNEIIREIDSRQFPMGQVVEMKNLKIADVTQE